MISNITIKKSIYSDPREMTCASCGEVETYVSYLDTDTLLKYCPHCAYDNNLISDDELEQYIADFES